MSGPSSTDEYSELLLNENARCLCGVAMPPLLTGELQLLKFLGSRPHAWHSPRTLARRVFQREDPVAIQLVWKYVSTLRKKLGGVRPAAIESCRLRGYRCRANIRVLSEVDA